MKGKHSQTVTDLFYQQLSLYLCVCVPMKKKLACFIFIMTRKEKKHAKGKNMKIFSSKREKYADPYLYLRVTPDYTQVISLCIKYIIQIYLKHAKYSLFH